MVRNTPRDDWYFLKNIGKVMADCGNKGEYNQKMNGLINGYKRNRTLTPTVSKKLKVLEDLKRYF